MKIYYQENTDDGSVSFYHEAILGPRLIAEAQSAKEIKAGKRPKMVPNPNCRIPKEAEGEISNAEYEKLFSKQADGMRIVMRGGKPVAVQAKISAEEHRAARRLQRDRLLAQSDWTQLPDSPLDTATRSDWQTYRQQLRDLDMDGGDWPVAPSAEDHEEAE